jgi:hypothetical protein
MPKVAALMNWLLEMQRFRRRRGTRQARERLDWPAAGHKLPPHEDAVAAEPSTRSARQAQSPNTTTIAYERNVLSSC